MNGASNLARRLGDTMQRIAHRPARDQAERGQILVIAALAMITIVAGPMVTRGSWYG